MTQALYQLIWHTKPATLCWYLSKVDVMSVPLAHVQEFSRVVYVFVSEDAHQQNLFRLTVSHGLPLLASSPLPPQSSTQVFWLALQ